MHPSEFFDNCSLRIGIDTFEIFDEYLKEKLKSIHPKNFLKTEITHCQYIKLTYLTLQKKVIIKQLIDMR